MILKNSTFTNKCTRCPRLTAFLTQIKVDFPDYYARPVPSFGDKKARLLVVGLAPGMHGANRTGRPFTGDHAGILLYQTLYNHGFSSSPGSETVTDDLLLRDCRITNAVRCLPPQNKPLAEEVKKCNQFLLEDTKNHLFLLFFCQNISALLFESRLFYQKNQNLYYKHSLLGV